MHRLGLLALIDALDDTVAYDATDPDGPDVDVHAVADAISTADGRADWRDTDVGVRAPIILATTGPLRGRDVLRHLTGEVRGVVLLTAPPTTWACAIAGVAARGYFVDPAVSLELVLLASVGTPYGPRPLGLTAQQQRILDEVACGLSNRAIARELGISTETVKTHLATAMRHLGAYDRVDAAQRLAAARDPVG